MIYKLIALLLFVSILSCSSSKFVDQWKNPDIVNYEANKVLVIGITSDLDSRKIYEQALVNSFDKHDVNAVKSIDFFEKSFSEAKKTQEQLNEIESQLMEAGFDTVLFSDEGIENNSVKLVGDLYAGLVKVDAQGNYKFSGSGGISGPTGIMKNGAGILRIENTNDYTGPTYINEGTILAQFKDHPVWLAYNRSKLINAMWG
jgi:autotransporter-associated beta strand protein